MSAQRVNCVRHAFAVSEKAAKVGFDWDTANAVLDKIQEEVDEVRAACAADEPVVRIEEELGDLFFALVNFARKCNINPERAFLGGARKFERRFCRLVQLAAQEGKSVERLDAPALDALWRRVKSEEGHGVEL